MRPEVSWQCVAGSRVWHTFLDGADTPVCGAQSTTWRGYAPYGRRMHVHKECRRLSGGAQPMLNRPMTEEEIARELD